MWRHFPWLAGLTLAPLLFGSVNPDGQAVVGLLVGVSLLLLASRSAPVTPASGALKLLWMLPACLAVTLVPLPATVIHWLSPETGALATAFPTSGATFLPFSLSPAASWQRIWELGILVAAAMAARLAARETGFPTWLVRFLAAAVLFEVLADVWYRMDGQRSILGYWNISWGKGAGTFANRNHFANWIIVACMVLIGPVIRELHPLRGARPDRASPSPMGRFDKLLVLVAVVAGIVAAIASASRGG
ncbi:MAG TPA: hypothetical protein VK968_05265, partial [Roseimicrobium sp.]|nr:hypothetical protein [Roseimicrobium sp.]